MLLKRLNPEYEKQLIIAGIYLDEGMNTISTTPDISPLFIRFQRKRVVTGARNQVPRLVREDARKPGLYLV
jgi:hypothetical protein